MQKLTYWTVLTAVRDALIDPVQWIGQAIRKRGIIRTVGLSNRDPQETSAIKTG